jgi:hypothetical protein
MSNQKHPVGRQQARVVRVNEHKSAKLGMFSTILSFNREVDTKYGKSIANQGFFGVMLTERKPDDLQPGTAVNVEITSYQTSINPNNEQETTIARCLFVGEVQESERAQASKTANPAEQRK